MTEDKAPYVVGDRSVVTLVGHIDIIKKIPSRQIVQVVIELPVEKFKDAVNHFDDKTVFCQVVSGDMKDMPYGVYTDSLSDNPAPKAEKKPIGKYCIEAIDFCKDSDFQIFMREMKGTLLENEQAAKDELCMICDIESRKELDDNEQAHSIAQDVYREFFNWNVKRD